MKNGFPILIFIFCLVTFQCEEHDPLKAECNLNNLSSTQLKSDRMSCWLPIETHPIYEYGQDSLKSYLESYLPGRINNQPAKFQMIIPLKYSF